MAANKFLELSGGGRMPTVGLGTWQAKDEAELKSALNTALELGYRHIDTAFAYQNEKIIGDVLKEWFSSGKLNRQDVFVTTKLPPSGLHPDRVELFLKKSLEDLQLDYVDLYLIHFPIAVQCDLSTLSIKLDANQKLIPEAEPNTAAVWKKLEEQVDAGRARAIGLSNYNSSQIKKILEFARVPPANLQVELHVYLQQKELVDFCQKNGVSVVAYAPLGSPGYNKAMKATGRKERPLPNILADPVVVKISKKHSKTPAQVVLRFLLQRGVVVIPKSVTPKRLQENFDVYDFSLDDGDVRELTSLDAGESARIAVFDLFEGIEKHPDFPLVRDQVAPK